MLPLRQKDFFTLMPVPNLFQTRCLYPITTKLKIKNSFFLLIIKKKKNSFFGLALRPRPVMSMHTQNDDRDWDFIISNLIKEQGKLLIACRFLSYKTYFK